MQKSIFEFLNICGYDVAFWNDKSLSESIELMSSCEYFVGVNSGPMHIAAGLGVKSVVILDRKDSNNIYLPKIAEADIPESEWLYPQNVHLSINNDNELIEKFSLANLKRALNGNLYPYFSLEYAHVSKDEINVINESGSLGDTIAWTPVVDKFASKKNKIINFYTPFRNLFEKEYPNINFLDYSEKPETITKQTYSLGCFDGFDYRSYSLQGVACKLLGLEEKEIKPKITINKQKSTVSNKKYVCIATQSTAQCKYWNRKDGWARVVHYLKALGYDVVCIDKHYSYGAEGLMNIIPENAINKTGDLPLEDRVNDLYNCEFFIGISSGLSWLAWACGKPVVLISGFTDPKSEFFTPYRVHNKNVCNSCWSDVNCAFDRNNWMWCPKAKDFECSKEITFKMVKEKIDLLILDKNIK